MAKSLEQVEACIGRVEAINHRAKMLAINARIEAARAGTAGTAFAVVANEVNELSSSTQSLAETMKTHMGEVVRGIQDSHAALREVSGIDVSGAVDAEKQLNRMVGALVERGAGLGRTIAEAASDADGIARQIGQIVTGMQFQDRVAPTAGAGDRYFGGAGRAIDELQDGTTQALPEISRAESPADIAWLTQLAGRYKLGEMRAKFVFHVVAGNGADTTEPPVALAPRRPARSSCSDRLRPAVRDRNGARRWRRTGRDGESTWPRRDLQPSRFNTAWSAASGCSSCSG
ncbi:MAG: methyl-accepting chemotaxis protein [Pseudomonadota bacterium]